MGTKYLESTEMWQPYENSEQSDKRYYEPQEILEMMHRLQDDETLTKYQLKRDSKHVVEVNEKNLNKIEAEFYKDD